MNEQNNAAPHECPQCGEPAYLGFGIPAKCVQKGCLFYDAELWCEWVMLLPDVPDPVELALGFRDFCSSCYIPVEFERQLDGVSGSYYAFCPQCGQPNVWS
jgi:predicted RNA-binding Zn-ribbon protein involved in translation (DUF1610 family)